MRKLMVIGLAILALIVAGCGSTTSDTSTATPVAQTTKKVVTAKELVDKIGEADVADFCRQYNDLGLGPDVGDAIVRGAIVKQYNEETIPDNVDAPTANEFADELISRC